MKKRWLFLLLAIDAVLIIAHILWGREIQLLNLDRERTPSSYYSGAKLVFISATAWVGFMIVTRRWEKALWGLFGFLFLELAFDEISELHENITYYLSVYIHPSQYFRSPTYMWLVFLSPFIVAGFALLVTFARYAARQTKTLQLAVYAGIAFLFTAVSLEFLSGILKLPSFTRWSPVFEEASEMLGATCIAFAIFSLVKELFEKKYQKKAT